MCVEIYDYNEQEQEISLKLDLSISSELFYMICLLILGIPDNVKVDLTEYNNLEELLSKIIFDGILQQNIVFQIVNEKHNNLSVFDIELSKKNKIPVFEIVKYNTRYKNNDIERIILYQFEILKKHGIRLKPEYRKYLQQKRNTHKNIKINDFQIKNKKEIMLSKK